MIDGFSDVTVRAATLGGARCVFKDNAKFTLDACRITTGALEIRQSQPGWFKNAHMEKCNVTTPRIVLFAPLKKGLNEIFPIDKCWFDGETSEKALCERVFTDADDDPASGVRVRFLKISDKPQVAAPGGR